MHKALAILTGLGFLVGVEGFKTVPASSQGARLLLLLFLVKSCPLTVRVWPFLRLILPFPLTTLLTLSGPRWVPTCPLIGLFIVSLSLAGVPNKVLTHSSTLSIWIQSWCTQEMRSIWLQLQLQSHSAKCSEKGRAGMRCCGNKRVMESNSGKVTNEAVNSSSNPWHHAYYIPRSDPLCLSFSVCPSLIHTTDFKPFCILPLFNPFCV